MCISPTLPPARPPSLLHPLPRRLLAANVKGWRITCAEGEGGGVGGPPSLNTTFPPSVCLYLRAFPSLPPPRPISLSLSPIPHRCLDSLHLPFSLQSRLPTTRQASQTHAHAEALAHISQTFTLSHKYSNLPTNIAGDSDTYSEGRGGERERQTEEEEEAGS